MNRYRLTDKRTILTALEKAKSTTGRSNNNEVKILGVEEEGHLKKSLLIDVEGEVDGGITFIFRDNLLKLKVLRHKGRRYRVRDVIIESLSRSSSRMAIEPARISDISLSAPIDLAAKLKDGKKNENMLNPCTAMKSQLYKQLNLRGFLIADCGVGFFHNHSSRIYEKIRESGQIFFIADALNSSVCVLEGFVNPIDNFSLEKKTIFFGKYAKARIRSEMIFPFRDHMDQILGYYRFISPVPGLGSQYLIHYNLYPKDVHLFCNFLRNKAEMMTFEMEMRTFRNWMKLASEESLLDISQDARGCRITVSRVEMKKNVRKGAKIRFSITLEGKYHSFIGTVRNTRVLDSRLEVGLRINRGLTPQSMEKLSKWAMSLMPSLE